MAHVRSHSHSTAHQSPQESSGDPYFLSSEPIVERLFAPSRAPSSGDVVKALSELQEFLDEPRAGNIPLAQRAARKLCDLLKKMGGRLVAGGRGGFRREYALATLEQVATIPASEEGVGSLHRMLTDDPTGKSSALSEPIMAGVTDLNEYRGSRLRRSYAREGGLCDVLAGKFADVVRYTNAMRADYQRKTSRRFDGSVPEAKIRAELAPIISRAREAMLLLPPGRALAPRFEERVAHVEGRLSDYHFADASRLMEGLVNDMRELKSVFVLVEGLDHGLGSKVALSRARRSAQVGPKLP